MALIERVATLLRANFTEMLERAENPEIALLPKQVRQLINLNDDPSLPTITFRYFFLCVLFVVPGAFLSQMSHSKDQNSSEIEGKSGGLAHYLGRL